MRHHKRSRASKKENLRVYDVKTGAALGISVVGCSSGLEQENVITLFQATNVGATPAAGQTSIAVLNQIPSTNNTGQSRSGRSLVMKSLSIKGRITFITPNTCFNMYLIYDRGSSVGRTTLGSADIQSMLLIGATSYPGGYNKKNGCPMSNVDQAPRYKIVKHWHYTLPSSASATHIIDDFVSLKDKETVFESQNTDGYWGAMSKGALYLVCVSDAALAQATNFEGGVRIYFKE